MKNNVNEAKECLKTRDVAVSNGTNCACFAYDFAENRALKDQKTSHFVQIADEAHQSIVGAGKGQPAG